jgi:outer membrane protein OmpA-like peptidoglycan-associated protein
MYQLAKNFVTIIVILVFIVLFAQIPLFAQGEDYTVFEETKKVLNSAKEAQADILAPSNYGEAMRYYREALEKKQRDASDAEIQKTLKASLAYLKLALEAIKLAEVTFNTVIKSRADALSSDAPDFAKLTWEKAEKKFEEAARDLEGGDVNKAKKKGSEANGLYRQAELEAIKANYLSETWELIEQAKKLNVKKYAPITLDKATKLVSQAENELNNNRYDTDVARGLAQQAKYEAKHAIYLSEAIKNLEKNKLTMEEILLAGEEPLARLAVTIDIPAEFDNGTDLPTAIMIDYVKSMQDSVDGLNSRVEAQYTQITEMRKILSELGEEHSEYKKKLAQAEKVRAQFTSVEEMFTRNEAQVFRQGDEALIRLVGLQFNSGQSIILPDYYSLLTKVQKAINTFPGCDVIIEGHTDSYGGDELNRQLSENRAAAVKQYLLANMSLEPHRITAVGFGENKPIASNQNAEGRAKNRRIDILIKPQLALLN